MKNQKRNYDQLIYVVPSIFRLSEGFRSSSTSFYSYHNMPTLLFTYYTLSVYLTACHLFCYDSLLLGNLFLHNFESLQSLSRISNFPGFAFDNRLESEDYMICVYNPTFHIHKHTFLFSLFQIYSFRKHHYTIS